MRARSFLGPYCLYIFLKKLARAPAILCTLAPKGVHIAYYRFDCRKSKEVFSLFNIVSVVSTPKTGEYVFKNRNTFIATPRMAVTGQQYGQIETSQMGKKLYKIMRTSSVSC